MNDILGDHPDLDHDSGYKGHIIARIRTDQVEWTMGAREVRGEHRPEETIFEGGLALAVLLANEAVFITGYSGGTKIDIEVLCNDVFMWGCADCEEMSVKDIESVYKHWLKDPSWGTAIWCMIKRKEMPQRPVEKRIREGGIWNFEELIQEHGLKPNYYDGVSHVIAGLKYEKYCTWQVSEGNTPLPWDKHWWEGWKDYTEAHPDWYSDEWKTEEKHRIEAWRAENGWTDDTEADK